MSPVQNSRKLLRLRAISALFDTSSALPAVWLRSSLSTAAASLSNRVYTPSVFHLSQSAAPMRQGMSRMGKRVSIILDETLILLAMISLLLFIRPPLPDFITRSGTSTTPKGRRAYSPPPPVFRCRSLSQRAPCAHPAGSARTPRPGRSRSCPCRQGRLRGCCRTPPRIRQ